MGGKKDRELEEAWAKERERIAAQRLLWDALPDLGPGGVAIDKLKEAMIDRALQLLDMGQCEACDALLEFLPKADVDAMLKEYFDED